MNKYGLLTGAQNVCTSKQTGVLRAMLKFIGVFNKDLFAN